MSCKKCKCKVCSCIKNDVPKIAVNGIVQNQNENDVVNIKVPTKTSQLINDSGFGQGNGGGTGGQKIENIRVNGELVPIINKEAIVNVPTKTSNLINDSNFATKPYVDTHIVNKANPHNVTKEQIGLGNVDNTSDLNKPISTATQLALDSKIPTTDVKSEIIYEDLKPINSKAVEKYAVKKINTIAELKNTVGEYEWQVIELLGITTAGDFNAIKYTWTDAQQSDNGGTIINAGNGSWLAVEDSIPFLVKKTKSDFINISQSDIDALKKGLYKGVTLLGYYSKGDTPSPIDYYLSDTIEVDDGYSVIEVGGVKFEHDFKGTIHLNYAGVKADLSVTDGAIIQSVLDSKPKIVKFPSRGSIILQDTLNIVANTGLTLEGNHCEIGFTSGVDKDIFTIVGQKSTEPPTARAHNINIKDFVTINQVSAQTFINADSAHHLHVSGCRTDGTKLFIKAINCYFMTVEKNMLFSIYQAFDFQKATNAFNIIGNSIHGAGIASYFQNNTTGGNISGNCFELSSGALHFGFGNSGVNIAGNYFEGYDATNFYIKLDGGAYQEVKGFNISGNLFYDGALYAIDLSSTTAIAIKGNNFGTKHAIRQYCYDGVRNSDVDYSANNWKSSVSGASEFLYYGGKQYGLIAPNIRTMNRFLPVDNNEVSNINDDLLFYNDLGHPRFKQNNVVYTQGWSTSLLSKTTVKDEVVPLNFNLRILSDIAKVYIFSGSGSNIVNEYTLIKSANNVEQLFLKPTSVIDITEILLSVNFYGNGLNFIDTVGGRFLQVVVSG